MRIQFQQGIITYPSTGSIQNFLQKTGVYVSLNAANGRTDIAFAHGVTNYLFTENVSVTNAWGPIPASTDAWLYWDLDQRTAVRTFGFTLLQPQYGTSYPVSPSNGQHFFHTTERKMYLYDAGKWRQVIRVFAAKVNNSTFTPLGSGITSKPFAGSQVGITGVSSIVGRVLSDDTGNPIRRSSGAFFTTEDDFFINGSPANTIRLEANVLTATAAENLAEYQVVYFSDFGKINVATYDDLQENAIAMLMESLSINETGTVITQGTVSNPAWNFSTVGSTLWVDGNGVLVETDPHLTDPLTFPQGKPPIGRVITPTTIFFDQGLGGKGEQGLPGPAATVDLATNSVAGIAKLTLAAADPANPIVVGDNDPRMTDARIPLTHTQPASTITFTPYGTITGSTAEIAIQQLENNKVKRSGDTMLGQLTLVGSPINPLHAATKQYVDAMTLDGLNDVTFVGSPSTDNVLIFNGSAWTNATLSLDDLSDVDVTTTPPVSGDFLQYDGTGWISAALSVGSLDSLTDVDANVDPLGDPTEENAWLSWNPSTQRWEGHVGQPYDAHFFMPSKASGIPNIVMGGMVIPREVTFPPLFDESQAQCEIPATTSPVTFTMYVANVPWCDIVFPIGSNTGTFDPSPYTVADYTVPAGTRVVIKPQSTNSEIEDVMITIVGCTTKLICP